MNAQLSSFQDKIGRIRELINRSRYGEALEAIERYEGEIIPENTRNLILLLIEKSRVLEYIGKFDDSQELIHQVTQYNNYLNDIELQIRNNITLSRITWKLGKHAESRQLAENTMGLLQSWEESSDAKTILEAHLYNTYGNVLRAQANLDQAIEYYRKSLILWEQVDDVINAALSLNNLGIIYFLKGEYNLALLYLIKHLNIVKSLDHIKFTAIALNNVGEIYRIRGDLDKSLEYIKQSLVLKEELGDKLSTIYTLQNIGLIENNMGERQRAMDHLGLALTYSESIGNPILQAEILFHLIHVNDHEETKTESMQLLQRLEKIAEDNPEREIILHARLAKALILKSQKRLKNIIEAEEILEDIISGEVVIHNLLIFALKHLCEIYLVELKITGKEQVMQDINIIVDRMYEIGLKNNLYQTLIEALILKSKIAMVNSDFSDTVKYLNEAEDLAISKRLTSVLKFIKSEKEQFQSEITKWTELLERNQDMSSRVELVKLASYLRDVQQFLST